MKEYPSIPHLNFPANVDAYIFIKYDGSNLRFEYSKKKGWYKFGTRHRTIDKNDLVFGYAIDLFKRKLAKDITDKLNGISDSYVVYCEYFGPDSFAGMHTSDIHNKELRLFDVNLYKKGFLSPSQFVKTFNHLETNYAAEFIGIEFLDKNFIDNARSGMYNTGSNDEGLICKWGEGHHIERLKIKTNQYLSKLKNKFSEEWQRYV